ncbi:hypothetical protein GM160_08610 [Guyparkeria halophila]|uniref:Uncharacterized protein n=1 Tax=Guyparkeria halophila TaxID=47960 RepID=A0A6I6CZT5_9GAMM|nr:hypothetical protein [Guyparkeria halophila]QGT78950.1 hypothetical protein GM160_08610 [Guyparkeria halophila]
MAADDKPNTVDHAQRRVFRTADLPPEQRNAAWNEIAAPFFDHVVPGEAPPESDAPLRPLSRLDARRPSAVKG